MTTYRLYGSRREDTFGLWKELETGSWLGVAHISGGRVEPWHGKGELPDIRCLATLNAELLDGDTCEILFDEDVCERYPEAAMMLMETA